MDESPMERENRYFDDRRKIPTPAISRYTLVGGRRSTLRREYDAGRCLFVDQHSTWLFAALMMLLVLSLADTWLTLILIDKGKAIEANPIMAFYLEHGIVTFITTKFLMTTMFLIIFCLFQNYYVRSFCLIKRTYENVYITRKSLPLVLKLYLLVVVYECYLIAL